MRNRYAVAARRRIRRQRRHQAHRRQLRMVGAAVAFLGSLVLLAYGRSVA